MATAASGGWEAIENQLRFGDWSQAQHLVALCRRLRHDEALTTARDGGRDLPFVAALPYDQMPVSVKPRKDTAVLTNGLYERAAVDQRHRDRSDRENGFDELKNLRGHYGCATQEMHRSRVTARAVTLVFKS